MFNCHPEKKIFQEQQGHFSSHIVVTRQLRNKPEICLSSSMEFSTILPLTQLSCFMPKTCTVIRAHPFKPWRQRNSKPTRFRCQKMYVPGNRTIHCIVLTTSKLHEFRHYIYMGGAFCLMQDLEKHHLKKRQPKTCTISSLILLSELLVHNWRFLPSPLVI